MIAVGGKMRKDVLTEVDWHEAVYPMNLIRFLGPRISERKKCLLAAACFRRIWHLLRTNRGRRAVEVLELYAEGLATAEQLAEAKEDAWQSTMEIPNPEGNNLPEHQALAAIGLHDSLRDMIMGAAEATAWVKAGTPEAISEPEEKAQCLLIRELFGNPFRPVKVDPAWLTPAVEALAQGIYDERRFADLPILADALEETGCINPELLIHCRQTAEHVRGCWALDLLLGQS